METTIGRYSRTDELTAWCPECDTAIEGISVDLLSEWFAEDRNGNEFSYLMYEATEVACYNCDCQFIAEASHTEQEEIGLEEACGSND